MSDLSINTTLRGTGSMPSRPASSGGGGGTVAPNPVPTPANFITSPKGTIDSNSGLYVVQFRDGDGQVTAQYPAPKASSAYKKGASVNASVSAPQGGGQSESSSKPAPKVSVSAPAKTDSV